MPYKIAKHRNEYYLFDSEVANVLQEYAIDIYDKISIAKSNKIIKKDEFTLVSNWMTDGKRIIMTRKESKITPHAPKNIPMKPPIGFLDGHNFSTFVNFGKQTFFTKFTKTRAIIYVPGGEVNVNKKRFLEQKPKTYTELFEIVAEYGGSVNTNMYDRRAYNKAIEEFEEYEIVPFYNSVFIISKNRVFFYDDEKLTMYFPFKVFNAPYFFLSEKMENIITLMTIL